MIKFYNVTNLLVDTTFQKYFKLFIFRLKFIYCINLKQILYIRLNNA
jgi:hypothetical protein